MSARPNGRQADPSAPHFGRINRAAAVRAEQGARRYAEQHAREAAAIDIQQTTLHRDWCAAIRDRVPQRVRALGVAHGRRADNQRETGR